MVLLAVTGLAGRVGHCLEVMRSAMMLLVACRAGKLRRWIDPTPVIRFFMTCEQNVGSDIVCYKRKLCGDALLVALQTKFALSGCR